MKYLITLFSIVPITLLSSANPTGCENPYWVKMEPTTSPPKLAYHAMAYDAESDRVVLFSGHQRLKDPSSLYSDTWAYDHNSSQWTNLNPENNPPGTAGHAMSYDAESDRIILFATGGRYSDPGDETWAFDFNSNSWTELNPTSAPPGRFGNNMAYDAESDRIIMFGGVVYPQTTDDTWSYDFNTNTWTEMNPSTSPPARQYHSMAYDSKSDRIILFGGGDYDWSTNRYTLLYDDTWSYDFNTDTWTQMMPATSPSARVYTDMTYNEECDRVVLFGGGTESFEEIDPDVLGHGNETWLYDYNSNTWQQVTTDQKPTYRKKHRLAYDSESDCVIMFGGDIWDGQGNTTDHQNETWICIRESLIGGSPVDDYPGWFLSEWFGTYYTGLAPWLFHAQHGFIYRYPESTKESMYAYDDAIGAWWWTGETVYPFIYAYDPPADNGGTDIEAEWLWYFEETKAPRSFGVVTGSHAGEFVFFGP